MIVFDLFRKWGILLIVVFLAACKGDSPSSIPSNTVGVSSPTSLKFNDWYLGRLKGRVKLVTEQIFEGPADVLKQNPKNISVTSFNLEGQILETNIYLTQNRVQRYLHSYISDSVKVLVKHEQGDSVFDQKEMLYLRGPLGERLKMLHFLPDGSIGYSTTMQNNQAGFPTEYQNQLSDEKSRKTLPCKELRRYDAQNFLIEEEWYRYNSETKACEPTHTIRYYENDEQGNCIVERLVKKDKILAEFRYDYQYDAKGNWTQRSRFQVLETGEKLNSITIRKLEYF